MQRVTMYETFDGSGLILAPGLKLAFESFALAEEHAVRHDMNPIIRKQFGSPVKRTIQEVCNDCKASTFFNPIRSIEKQ
jgi:hypothetical protein